MTDQANATAENKDTRPRLSSLPDDLHSALATPGSFSLHHSVSDITDFVRSAFAKAASEEAFSMAEPRGAWEATDVIRDPKLPRRRLTSVAINGAFCLLFYEHGGIGKNDNVVAFRISHDRAEPIWHAYLDPGVANPAGLRDAIGRERVRSGGFL
jgi:hypothetical protein